jgi:hypothetical protein
MPATIVMLAGISIKSDTIRHMKKIIVKNDEKEEIKLFTNFLNNKEFPQHKNIIFFSFPELKEKLDLQKESEIFILEEFLKTTREKNKENIQKSVDYIKKEADKNGEKTLKMLSDLMDYKWKSETQDYFLIPTIFPLSPFSGNTFYYSIYKSLQGITEYPNVLAVSAHEISHVILFEILKENNIRMGQELFYFVKEIIAPVLVFQDDFDGIFKKEIVGNYNVLEIYFKENDKSIRAFDYFQEKFIKNKANGKKFIDYLEEMVSFCQKIEKQIQEKRMFDNKYGIQIMKNPELLEQFREPICLD